MSRRYASRRYAGGLGPSRIRTRIPTTRQLGQWVSLRKTLRFRVRRYNGGFLPDIIWLTQGYYHWGTRLNAI